MDLPIPWGKSNPKTPPRWSWHYRKLVSLRESLLRQRKRRLSEASNPFDPLGTSQANVASDEFDHNLALGELSADQDVLYEIEEALKRILAGTYGFCQETGKRIPAARLRAIPWARFTAEIERRLERDGVMLPPHLGTLRSLRQPSPEPDPAASESEDDKPTTAEEAAG